jgi:hypothetical protein
MLAPGCKETDTTDIDILYVVGSQNTYERIRKINYQTSVDISIIFDNFHKNIFFCGGGSGVQCDV